MREQDIRIDGTSAAPAPFEALEDLLDPDSQKREISSNGLTIKMYKIHDTNPYNYGTFNVIGVDIFKDGQDEPTEHYQIDTAFGVLYKEIKSYPSSTGVEENLAPYPALEHPTEIEKRRRVDAEHVTHFVQQSLQQQ